MVNLSGFRLQIESRRSYLTEPTDKPLPSVGEQPVGITGKVFTCVGLQKSFQRLHIEAVGGKQLVE